MIETTDLVKRYGSVMAVDHVDVHVEAGSVYGLVGRNGAGKSTLLGLLAGLKQATSGTLRIDSEASGVAMLPDTPQFDPWLTGTEVVSLAQHLSDSGNDRVGQVLHEVGLEEAAARAVGKYSRGMLQRLGIACTMVGSPKVVLLDEPASALDPIGRREVLDLVSRMRGSATVLFSSHILADVQEVCDTVGILDHGRLRFQGTLDSLLVGAAVPRYIVRLRSPVGPVVAALRDLEWVTDVHQTGSGEMLISVLSLEAAESRLVRVLADLGARVVSVGPEAVSLERAFLEATA